MAFQISGDLIKKRLIFQNQKVRVEYARVLRPHRLFHLPLNLQDLLTRLNQRFFEPFQLCGDFALVDFTMRNAVRGLAQNNHMPFGDTSGDRDASIHFLPALRKLWHSPLFPASSLFENKIRSNRNSRTLYCFFSVFLSVASSPFFSEVEAGFSRSGLTCAGISKTLGSTLSYCISVMIVVVSMPPTFCVIFAGIVKSPNFLYSFTIVVDVTGPSGDSCVAVNPFCRPDFVLKNSVDLYPVLCTRFSL